MPTREIIFSSEFIRSYKKLPPDRQEVVDQSLRHLQDYLNTHNASVGLGIKCLYGKTYEFRAGLSLRGIYVLDGNRIILSLLGTHDEVRRFIKHRR